MDPLLYKGLGLLCIFAGIFAFLYALLPGEKQREAKRRFEEQTTPGESTRFINVFRPLFPIFRPIADILPLERYKRSARKLTITANLDRELSVTDFLCFQMVCLLLFGLMGFMLWKDWFAALLLGAMGVGYPYLWLWEKKRTRQREIALSMPNVVDMLSLSVEAGLDFLASVRRIAEVSRDKDPFIQELSYMYQNIKLGMSTEEALVTMAERVDIQEMYSFTSILVQAQKMGSSIANVLRSQAERMRQQRFTKAERMGAVAAQKLLIPMMLCIFPILFIIIFGPYLLKFIYNR